MLSVGGIPLVTVIRNTVMFSMVEIPRVTFSPDSAGIRKTKLRRRTVEGKTKSDSLQRDDVDEDGGLDVVEEEELWFAPHDQVVGDVSELVLTARVLLLVPLSPQSL